MKWILGLALSSLLTLLILPSVSFTQEYQEVDKKVDEVVEKANSTLRKYGLKEANVQLSPEGRLVLTGVFDTYDEFLYALMLMNIHFGFDKIKPIYDNRLAVIRKTPTELCFPYVVVGQECPYGRFTIQKKIGPAEKRTTSKKYALVIGVYKFADEKIPKVPGADEDAKAFAEYLKKNGYETKLLINEQATINNVRQAISDLYSKVQDGDTLVVFAASHGAPVDESGEVGIVLYDSGAISSERYCKAGQIVKDLYSDAAIKMCTLVKNGLSMREHVVNTFADKKVNLVVLLDACYSGDALKSYVGLGLPYEVATTEEYEKALRHAPNLGIMVTAASGNRMSWGGPMDGEFRQRLLAFSEGTPRVIRLDGSAALERDSAGARAIAVERKATTKKAQDTNTSLSHGVFTAFLLEALSKSDNSLARAYELSKDDVNYVSEFLCKQAQTRGQTAKCPPGGQNPMLFRVRMEDYNFGR